MTATNPKLMRAASILMLVVAVMMLLAGAYITFAKGETFGVVLLGLSGTHAALGAVFGSLARNQGENHAN